MLYYFYTFVLATIVLFSATVITSTDAASFPSGNSNSSSSLGNQVSPTSTQMNNQLNSQNNQKDKGAPPTDIKEAEPNPILYENYQQCYASLISDVIGRPAEEVDARKSTIKKYCKTMSRVKYQKRFSDCFNSNMGSSNGIDIIIDGCISSNDKSVK